jgi:hypothetical protein
MKFEETGHYALEPEQMRRLWRVAERLYSQDRLSGDDMRSLAQEIHAMLERGIYLPERQTY